MNRYDIFQPGKKRWVFITLVFLLLGIGKLINFISLNSSTYMVINQVLSKQSPLGITIILKLAHGAKKTHPTNIIAQEVAKEINDKTNGKIKLEIYDNMQFGEEIELIDLVQRGKLDFAIVSTGPLTTYDSSIGILDLPYLFSSSDQANKALDGKPGQLVLKTLASCGLDGICYWENGFRSLTTRDRLVKCPEDLRSLHIRVMQSPVYISFFSKLGADPTPMAWGEVIPSLKAGIIDAQENPIPIIYQNNLEKYQQYLILTEHSFNPHVVLTNSFLRAKLTQDEIHLIYSIFQNACSRQRHLVAEQNKDYLILLKSKGMKIIKPDIREFRRRGREFSKEALNKFEPMIAALFERYF